MILERPFILFVFPAIFLAIGLAIASFNVSPTPYKPIGYELNSLASITENQGRVEISRYHTSHSSPLPNGKNLEITLFNRDKIQTRLASNTRLSFLDGYELEFTQKAMFVIEQWDPTENQGPVYLNVLAGDYKVIKKGRPGSLFIVNKGRIFAPSRKPKTQSRMLALVIHPTLTKQVEIEPPTKDAEPTNVVKAPEPPLIKTLTNQYIDKTIAKNRDQFVKCQQYAIRENKLSKGQLLVGISIEPLGRMKDVQVLASDIDNPELHECIRKVMGRTVFRSFDGPEIIRSYPLIFE